MLTGESPPTAVLVLWADRNAANLGLRALAEGTQNVAESVWGNVDPTFHSHNTEGTPLTRKAVLADIGRRKGPIKTLISQFDVVMDTGGGDSFTDIYGLRRLLLQAYMHRAARKVGCPVVMTPQTVGPFDTRLGRVVGKKILARATFVASRDPVSSAYATKLGRSPDYDATDLVFSLDQPNRATGKRDVLVNVSGLLWNRNPHVDYEKYRLETLRLVESLLERGRSVTLMAHVLESPSPDNDVPAVNDVGRRFPGVEVLVPSSLHEARLAISSANLLVGARMHACLNALSVGTPSVSWAYSRKFEPLLSTLGWSLCVDLRDEPDPSGTTLLAICSGDSEVLSRHTARARNRADVLSEGLNSSLRSAVPL